MDCFDRSGERVKKVHVHCVKSLCVTCAKVKLQLKNKCACISIKVNEQNCMQLSLNVMFKPVQQKGRISRSPTQK